MRRWDMPTRGKCSVAGRVVLSRGMGCLASLELATHMKCLWCGAAFDKECNVLTVYGTGNSLDGAIIAALRKKGRYDYD